MSEETNDASATADREIITTRVFDAPRELVFKVWTDSDHVKHWWGPNGFTITTHAMNVTPGGVWRFMMHGPDGVDYPNRIAYEEVVEAERLVYMHGSDDEPNQFQVTVTFVEENGKTRVTMRAVFPTKDACDAVKKFGAVEGGQQTLARLDQYLTEMK